MTSSKPSRFALIIGAMKCGTTTLFDLLSQHPQVAPCREKEPDFFTKAQPSRSRAEYLGLWSWTNEQHSVAIEASVSYTKLPYHKGVAARIEAAALGDVRFIYLMRHPIQRIESHLRHGLYAGWGTPLEQGMSHDLLAFTRYATQLDEYRGRFGRDSLLPLFLDDLEREPDAVLARVCRFLDIDHDHVFDDPARRSNTGDLYTAAPWVGALGRNPLARGVIRRVIPQSFKATVRSAIARLRPPAGDAPSTTLKGRYKLNAEEQAEVWRQLEGEFSRLEQEYGLAIPAAWRAPATG
jgi:hypothetical protein